jgi:hypothetical protein
MEKKEWEVLPNTGTLNASKVKKSSDSPDYFGEFKIDLSTVEIENNQATFKLSGWKKQSRSGGTYLSLAVNTWKPDGQQTKSKTVEIEDDEIPF